ncbi:TIR domain-containing protein [Cellulosimicrobium funkei]
MVKVFISWSGLRSKEVATALRDWLPQVIQEIEPWVSQHDIPKGRPWNQELTESLAGTSEGIICVTRENVGAAWLNYEAGALAKNSTEASVRTALFGLGNSDVVGPLSNFQHTALSDEADVFQMVQSINTKCDRPLPPDVLQRAFDRVWPELEERLAKIPPEPKKGAPAPTRSQVDLLKEVLERVRNMERSLDDAQLPSKSPLEPFPVGTRVSNGIVTGTVAATGRKYLIEKDDGSGYTMVDSGSKTLHKAPAQFDFSTAWDAAPPTKGSFGADDEPPF